MSKMRMTLVISSLARGGAERVLSFLASSWAEQGKEITLLTVDRGDPPAYPLHPAIKLIDFDLPWPSRNYIQGIFRNFRRIRMLRSTIRESRPDLVVSFMDRTNVLVLLATRGLRVPVVVSERTDPSRYHIGWLWGSLRLGTYWFADGLVCQTGTVLSWFKERIRIRGYVIPNPVILPIERQRCECISKGERGLQVMVAMGRLVHEKGFDLLLEAFSRIAHRHPDWMLKILGQGPLALALQNQISVLGLRGQIELSGSVRDPFEVLTLADLFVLSSRVEGFPNALCEAMACGLPVVSFHCAGAAEIIRNGVDGLLVPAQDVDALAAVLDRLMGDPEERRKLAARAPEVLSRFSKDKILDLWERMFEDLAPGVAGKERGGAQAMDAPVLEQPARSDSQ